MRRPGEPGRPPVGRLGRVTSLLLEVGRIGRAHGLAGEVTVKLVSNRPERLAPGSVLATDRGPLEVVSSRPHRDRFLVAFAGIAGRDQAAELTGLALRAEPLEDPDELWVHELIGARVFDRSGADRGAVAGVVANPASDLLELDDGSLVPVRFIISAASDRIEVDAPDGLFEPG